MSETPAERYKRKYEEQHAKTLRYQQLLQQDQHLLQQANADLALTKSLLKECQDAKTTPLRRGIQSYYLRYDRATGQTEFQAIKRLGCDHVRVPFDMVGWINPDGSLPNWVLPTFDDLFEDARMMGLTVGAMLEQVPQIFSGNADPYYPPKPNYVQTYAAAFGHFAERYQDQGLEFIEPGNEPNLGNLPGGLSTFWKGSVQQLVDTHRAIYQAVKAVSNVHVSTPGFAYGDTAYLERCKAAGLTAGYYDSIAMHPYAQDEPHGEPLTDLDAVRDWMNANGAADKPIRITEYGWPSFRFPMAQWHKDMLAMVRDQPGLKVASMCAFVLRSFGAGEWDDAMSLLNWDFTPKAGITDGMFT